MGKRDQLTGFRQEWLGPDPFPAGPSERARVDVGHVLSEKAKGVGIGFQISLH